MINTVIFTNLRVIISFFFYLFYIVEAKWENTVSQMMKQISNLELSNLFIFAAKRVSSIKIVE